MLREKRIRFSEVEKSFIDRLYDRFSRKGESRAEFIVRFLQKAYAYEQLEMFQGE